MELQPITLYIAFVLIVILAGSGYLLLRRRSQTTRLDPITPIAIVAQLKPGVTLSGLYQGHSLRIETTTSRASRASAARAKTPSQSSTRLVIEAGVSPVDTSRTAAILNQVDFATGLTELLFPDGLTYRLKGELFITAKGRSVIYDQPGLERNQLYLDFLLRTLSHLIDAYPAAVALGGEAVFLLQFIRVDPTHPLYEIIPQLLRDIELDTTARLSKQPGRFFCRRCLARCGPHKLTRPDLTRLKYYGCRVCHQSHDLFEGQVVLTLDSQMSSDQAEQGQVLRVNWLAQPRLFDFHEVEIKQASDEEIHQFIELIDQDPNLVHQHRYRHMRCLVATERPLPGHTLRRLQELFEHVEVQSVPQRPGFRPGSRLSEKLW